MNKAHWILLALLSMVALSAQTSFAQCARGTVTVQGENRKSSAWEYLKADLLGWNHDARLIAHDPVRLTIDANDALHGHPRAGPVPRRVIR